MAADADPDLETLREAFAATPGEPTIEALFERFCAAFERTGGDTHSAMAAVNEVLATPITYDVLAARLERAA